MPIEIISWKEIIFLATAVLMLYSIFKCGKALLSFIHLACDNVRIGIFSYSDPVALETLKAQGEYHKILKLLPSSAMNFIIWALVWNICLIGLVATVVFWR